MKKNLLIKGQSLFEVVVALAIITLILVSVVAVASLSIRNTSFSRNKTLATRLSQETVEWLRGQRDDDWAAFKSHADQAPTNLIPWCMQTLAWPDAPGECSSGDNVTGTTFYREVFFPAPSSDSIPADVRVYWTDPQGFHEVKSSTVFTNWRTN